MIPRPLVSCASSMAAVLAGFHKPIVGPGAVVFQAPNERLASIDSFSATAERSCAPSPLSQPAFNLLRVIMRLGADDFSANAWPEVAMREVYRRCASLGIAYSFAEWAPSCRGEQSLFAWAETHGVASDFALLEAPAVVGSAETRRAVADLGSFPLPADILPVLKRFLWTLDAVEARDGRLDAYCERKNVVDAVRGALWRGIHSLRILDIIRSARGENLPLLRLRRLIALLSARPEGNNFLHKLHELEGRDIAKVCAFEGMDLAADLRARVGEIERIASFISPRREALGREWMAAFEGIRRAGAPTPEDFLRKVVALWRTPEAEAFVSDLRFALHVVPSLEGQRLAVTQASDGEYRLLFVDPRLARDPDAQRSAWMVTAATALHEHAGHVGRFRERGADWHRNNLVASECEAFLIEIKHRLLIGDDYHLRYFARYSPLGWEWGLRNVIEETYLRHRKPPDLIPPEWSRFFG